MSSAGLEAQVPLRRCPLGVRFAASSFAADDCNQRVPRDGGSSRARSRAQRAVRPVARMSSVERLNQGNSKVTATGSNIRPQYTLADHLSSSIIRETEVVIRASMPLHHRIRTGNFRLRRPNGHGNAFGHGCRYLAETAFQEG